MAHERDPAAVGAEPEPAGGARARDLRHHELVDAIQAARGRCVAIVINPGALTHYSYALTDALAAFEGVKLELHLSNPSARETWRRTSVVAPVVTGTISGLGRHGYRLAIEATAALLEDRP